MNKLAQNSPFGSIKLPEGIEAKYPGGVEGGAIGTFLNLIIRSLIVGAGIYALFNLVLAGYAFMSAGDDPKKMAGAFVLAAIIGQLIFGDPAFILNPTIPTP